MIAADGHWSTVRRSLRPDAPRDLGEWHAVRQYFDGVDDERLWVLFERDLLPGYAWVFPLPERARQRRLRRVASDGRSRQGAQGAVARAADPPERARRARAGRRARGDARAWPIPTRYDPARLADGRVLFAGDAAGVVDPMTGEGIAQAIETALLAADAIATGEGRRRRAPVLPEACGARSGVTCVSRPRCSGAPLAARARRWLCAPPA